MNTQTQRMNPSSFLKQVLLDAGRLAMAIAFVMIGAGLAGHFGLGPKLEPLLMEPKFSALLLMMASIGVVAVMLAGIWATARDGGLLGERGTSIWAPLRMAAWSIPLLPLQDGTSPLVYAALWATRAGAGL